MQFRSWGGCTLAFLDIFVIVFRIPREVMYVLLNEGIFHE